MALDVFALAAISKGRLRRELFEKSLKAFAPPLAAQGYESEASETTAERLGKIETGSRYTRPLAIQMEALLCLASAAPEAGAAGVDVLLDRVLGLERRHWQKLVDPLDEEGIRDMARGVAQVTVVQGTPSVASTERLLMADDFYKGERTARVAVDPVVQRLSRVYGAPDGGIRHLEPDLIGEHHVASVGDVELIDGCLRWIDTEPPETRQKRRRDLVTTLQRATQPEHGAKAGGRAASLLDHLIATHAKTLAAEMVAVMIDTPGALAERLDRQVESLDDGHLGAIDAALPIESLSLMDLSLRLAERRVVLARESGDSAALAEDTTLEQRETISGHLAGRLNTLGIRFSNLGRQPGGRGDPKAPGGNPPRRVLARACNEHGRQVEKLGGSRPARRSRSGSTRGARNPGAVHRALSGCLWGTCRQYREGRAAIRRGGRTGAKQGAARPGCAGARWAGRG